jgi:hypothetical protein
MLNMECTNQDWKIQKKTILDWWNDRNIYDSRYDIYIWRIIKILIHIVDGDDVYLEYYGGKGFHINYSVYMSYV